MKVTLIGSNGLLADSIGKYCNACDIELIVWGLNEPTQHKFAHFNKIDLISEHIDIKPIIDSNLIIYAVGAGIQSNLNESSDLIYKLNLYTPIHISIELEKSNYKGTFITFGSYFEIGENTENIKFDEYELLNSILKVPNDYCVSKRMLTKFANSKQFNYKYLHTILPTIYGENESTHRLIPYTIKAIKNGDELNFTSGNQVRQYLYIHDLPIILFKLINSAQSGIYNIPGIETFTVKQFVEIIFNFYNKGFSEEIFGKAQRVDIGMLNLQMNGEKLMSVIENFQFTQLKDTLIYYDSIL